MRLERRQLLQHLQDANEQIMDLHDELGPAIFKGCASPTRTNRRSGVRAAARESAAAAAASADLGRPNGEGVW
jgi:hypothetical protein